MPHLANDSLGAIAAFCSTVLLGMLLYRIVSVVLWMIIGRGNAPDKIQTYARLGLLNAGTGFLMQICISLVRLSSTAARTLFALVWNLLPFIIFGVVMALLQERWAEGMIMLADGVTLTVRFLVGPIKTVGDAGAHLMPVYNMIMYTLFHFPTELLLWLVRDSHHMAGAIRDVSAAVSPLMTAAGAFVDANIMEECQFSRQVCDATTCFTVRDPAACVDTRTRGMDFMPAFRHLMRASDKAIHSIDSIMISTFKVYASIILFPLTDKSIWMGIDRGINAVLNAVIVAPSVAALRCKLGGTCTPDFAPAFDLCAEACLLMGDGLTQWLNKAYTFIFHTESAVFVSPWSAASEVFGSNSTVVVRMTPSMYAITDGNTNVFVDADGRTIIKRSAWSVDASYGIARTLLSGGEVGLFGCVCANLPTASMHLQCVVATVAGEAHPVNIAWSLAAETKLLTCQSIRLSVQPLRWSQPRSSIRQSSTVLAADVALYVIPICGGKNPMACFSEDTFTRGICFPYCMGLRMQHEGSLPITIRGAKEWTEGVVVAMRDCASTASAYASAYETGGSSTNCASKADLVGQDMPSQAAGNNCAYAWHCTAYSANKTTVTGYDATSRIVLDGQPFAVAGGMQLISTTTGAGKVYFDFPTIVGDQYNEFTIESLSTFSGDAVKVRVPPIYVQHKIPYNPATVSPEAFWYATNPSYDWISAFAKYCASKGADAETQVMILNTYDPPRLNRMRYHASACYISSVTNSQVCAPDVFTSVPIPDAIPELSSSKVEQTTVLYDMCASGQQFNLWVESMEFFDANNIVVAVRRGTVADLVSTTSSKTVYYFVNTSDVTMMSSSPMGESRRADIKVADLGGVVGHSLAALAHLAKVPVNFIANPFAAWDLINARASGTCPANDFMHSAKGNCGMQLLSLDNYFDSVYAANAKVWESALWIISFVDADPMLNNVLNGGAVVGEATKIVTLTRTEKLFDGMFNFQQRRLLSFINAASSSIKVGVSGVFRAAASGFAGADIGALVAMSNPLMIASISASPVAWAQFVYETAVPVVLDSVSYLITTSGRTTLWTHVHESLDRYDIIIDSRQHRACAGMRYMAGQNTFLADAVYESCMASAAFPRAVLSIATILFADMELYRCLCVHSAGQDYVAYIRAECPRLVVPSRAALWQSITLEGADVQGLCSAYLRGIETQATTAFDGWAMRAEASARGLSSLLEELISAPQSNLGCSSIQRHGSIVLTPTPVSHYRMCARTTLCESRCYDSFRMFRYELERAGSPHAAPSTFDLSAESPFFNTYASYKPYVDILAIATMPAINASANCLAVCGGDATCIAMIERTAPLAVRFFCLPNPKMMMASVFPMGLDSYDMDVKAEDVTHAEILWPLGEPSPMVFLYMRGYEIHLWSSESRRAPLLGCNDLTNTMFTPYIVHALFEDKAPQQPEVVECVITASVPAFVKSQLILYISFTVQIKSATMKQTGYTLNAIATWPPRAAAFRKKKIEYLVPCTATGKECGGVDALMEMASQGTFLLPPGADDASTLYLPSATATTADMAALFKLSPRDGAVGATFFEFKNDPSGLWTRGNVFSNVMRSTTRNSVYHLRPKNPNKASMRSYYFFQVDQNQHAWLQEMRPSARPESTEIEYKPYKSQQTAARARVEQQCTTSTCAGCSTQRLRLLCSAAQDCALVRCIGTMVHTRNSMCGLGSVLEQTSIHAIVTWRAVYAAVIELAMLAMRGLLSQEIISRVTLHFPTDQFYALLCTCKDTYAKVIGLGVSIGNEMTSKMFGPTGDDNIMSFSTADDLIKGSSVAGLAFNAITGATLLPTLALHRWIICTANASQVSKEGSITVEFGDITMDKSWLECASVGGMASMLEGNDMAGGASNVVDSFVAYAMSLMSGLGETILYAMQLAYDSVIDFVLSMVWSVQDILYAFNLRACKLPNSALRYVMECACGDTPHMIPQPQRSQTVGALWCVGTLNVQMPDGSFGIINNPYSLDELSQGIRGVTEYVKCMSESMDCQPPYGDGGLPLLTVQGVDPVVVWTRCKSNYALKTWDEGAGALYSHGGPGVAWAADISPEFLSCMRDHYDPTICLTMYHSIVNSSTPSAYFLYQAAQAGQQEPPDACLVFSGLRDAAAKGSALRAMMDSCEADDEFCDINPLGPQNKVAASAIHGTVRTMDAGAVAEAYEIPLRKLRKAYAEFNSSSASSLGILDVAIFSADGDFIHEYFDCAFMGPYSRVDVLPCDAEGVLECPFYAKPDAPCFGDDEMRGDHRLPFTCGSRARRALIKYFFRDYYTKKGNNNNLTKLITEKVASIYANYSNRNSMGCAGADGCSISACSYDANGYAPCMDAVFELSANEVGKFVIDDILSELPAYYAHVMHSNAPWMTYYNDSADARAPFDWTSTEAQAAAAQRLSHFSPSAPTVAYGMSDVYAMKKDDTSTSIWSMCAALLGHPAMSMPPQPAPLGGGKVEEMVRTMTQAAMKSASPFVWHSDRRHAPSKSSVCRKQRAHAPQGRLMVEEISIETANGGRIHVRPAEGLSFPNFGYNRFRIGDPMVCVCGIPSQDNSMCYVTNETCATIEPSAMPQLAAACLHPNNAYDSKDAEAVRVSLTTTEAAVRCPELAPSDIWGLFPAGCTTRECPIASSWTTAGGVVPFDGSRFLTEGRAGLRLPNYRHVNATYHSAVNYFQSAPQRAEGIEECFDVDELTTAAKEVVLDRLLPATQLRFDSPVTATCSRYVSELVRAEIIGDGDANAQAASWKRRCEAKIRQLATCDSLGMYFDVPPQQSTHDCGPLPPSGDFYFAGAACVLVDRINRIMYDGPICTRNGAVDTRCEMVPQPLSLLRGDTPYSMVWWQKQRLSDDFLSNLSPDLTPEFIERTEKGRDHMISHVLDWWTDSSASSFVGYHPTAASDPAEFAPVLFDSHLLYDAESATVYYAHSAARNASLLYDTMGAAGVCRSINVDMPMFTANTNRVCTRAPLDEDSPHMPVAAPRVSKSGYAEELCAESHRDTPWRSDDPQSLSVGGIAGWQTKADMTSGKTVYPYSTFPLDETHQSMTSPINSDGWSSECSPVWGVPSSDCPAATIPLKLHGDSVCYSMDAFNRDKRTPCFTTEHCQDGMVCLADGGCSPLTLHMWNKAADEDLEFTVMADECGFQEPAHPYTQTTRGASPWEQVPDLMHMHGMCSHRNWFSYRHAMRDARAPAFNATTTRWPWVHERFDLQSATQQQSMEAGRALFAVPHACDAAFFHLKNPATGRRLKVCSGEHGRQEMPPDRVYSLDDSSQASSQGGMIARWMRTYSETTGEFHIGKIQADDDIPNPLGFIGADVTSAGTLGAMAFGKANFFRCADRLACQPPTFTFNGVEQENEADESSLRRCGSIGKLSDNVCTLDVSHFPLFAQNVWGKRGTGGCAALWPTMTNVIIMVDTLPAVATTQRAFMCSGAVQHVCIYAPRKTLTDDSVDYLTDQLNSLLRATGDVIRALSKTDGPTRTYEHINRCAAQLSLTVGSYQSDFVTAANNGLYYALRVTLYEFPIAWFHHAMLVTLLSVIDTQQEAPRFNSMGIGQVRVFLWSADDKAAACGRDDKSTLWNIICTGLHPEYAFEVETFDASGQTPADALAAAIRGNTAAYILNQMDTSKKAVCYRRAEWKCSPNDRACADAIVWAYNTTACAAESELSKYLDPCGYPELFDLLDPEEVSFDDARKDQRKTSMLVDTEQRMITPIDFVASPAGDASFLRVWPHMFDFNDTADSPEGQCRLTMPSACSSQDDVQPTDNCLYRWTVPDSEMERYYQPDSEPSIKLFYNGETNGATTTVIPLCDLFSYPKTEACVTQYNGDTDTYISGQTVSCDISAIEVPPGIEVQAFVVDRPAGDWMSGAAQAEACSRSRPCTWRGDPASTGTDPIYPAWWANGSTAKIDSDTLFGRLEQDFEGMENWWPGHRGIWMQNGCGRKSAGQINTGVCAIRVRLEQSASAHAVLTCGDTEPACGDGYKTPFLVARAGKSRLSRCAACTRYSSQVVPPKKNPNNNLLIGCKPLQPQDMPVIADMVVEAASLNNFAWRNVQMINGTAMHMSLPLTPSRINMDRWGRRSVGDEQSAQWLHYDISFTVSSDEIVWKKALDNPEREFTMMCNSQYFTQKDMTSCNPRTDTRRRLLSEFVDAQYRATNGVWMHVAPRRSGVAWRANVAHSSVGMFSIVYASTMRHPREVYSSWVLGDGPCATSKTNIMDRICAESQEDAKSGFEAMHPWMGGDFNPFDGLDECPGTTGALCPCGCSPASACENPLYTEEFMKLEFPSTAACMKQSVPQTRGLRENDESNICSTPLIQKNVCLHTQGILGGAAPALRRPVTSDELHGDGAAAMVKVDDGLWHGGTAGGNFLRMDRGKLHPAHVAFSIDETLTGAPLVVAALGLLEDAEFEPNWTSLTGLDWTFDDDNVKVADAKLAASLFPQIAGAARAAASWSCPIRAAAFWGGGGSWGPVVPYPPLMAKIYPTLKGAHPYIETRSIADELAPYTTTNGACFYLSGGAEVNDFTNPCSLQRMLSSLSTGAESLSRVVDSFDNRCNRILDTPDVSATLRNGEKIVRRATEKCGVLHRLTPFKMRVRGDAGKIVARKETTRDEGGDCHMGRAIMWAERSEVAGTQCALVDKNETHATAKCPFNGRTIVFRRARPLALEEILVKKERRYRSQGLSAYLLKYVGPGGVAMEEPEVSFGMLYSASLTQTLSNDIARRCASIKCAGNFTTLPPAAARDDASFRLAQTRDDDVWRNSSINRPAWKKNRFAACSAAMTTANAKVNAKIKSIPLCDPAPTPELQVLCKALTQYRIDIASVNCQFGGDCLYKPGAFYTPYANMQPTSTSNQQFAVDAINDYYKSIVAQPRFAASWSAVCPSRNGLLARIAAVSHAQAKNCPANQIEFLKDVLKTIKLIGKDILELGYCAVMFAANAIASAFGSASNSAAAMTQSYLARFMDIAGRIIMPVLDAVMTVLFGRSGVGQVMREALRLLCEVYNFIVAYWYQPVWCAVLRPTLQIVLDGLSRFIRMFDRGVADKISDVWTAISGGGSASDCMSNMVVGRLVCPTTGGKVEANVSEFAPQAFATRCWLNSGGGITSPTAYLSCTSSDTCATDSTHFDNYDKDAQLSSCASCPDSSFGCNTYLKRCSCGAASSTPPGKCTSSSDCRGSMCAVSSRLDNIADAFTSVPCNECGGSGMHATCVEGTCACVDITHAGTVQTCVDRGRPISIIGTSASSCFASSNPDYRYLIQGSTLDFSTLAVVPCIRSLASSGAYCMGVSMPLSSGMGQFAQSMIVIFMPNVERRAAARALLSADADADDIQQQLADVMIAASNNCSAMISSREDIKQCIYWRLSAVQNSLDPAALLTFGGTMSAMASMAATGNHKALRSIIDKHSGVLPSIVGTAVSAAFAVQYRPSALAATAEAKIQVVKTTAHDANNRGDNKQSSRRRLLASVTESPTVPGITPFEKISDVVLSTISYYQNGYDAPQNDTQTLNITTDDLLMQTLSKMMNPRDIISELVSTGGRRIFREIGVCNYTTLTNSPPARGGLIYIIVVVAILTALASCACAAPLNWAIWVVVFPIAVLWCAYGTSPMCFPMLPPRLPSDIAAAIVRILPDDIPRFSVSEDCSLRGVVHSNDTGFSGKKFDAKRCFKQCDAPPFSMRSWQDTAAWWLCDISPQMCVHASSVASKVYFLQDFEESATYFAEVIRFGNTYDADFVSAHRLCAVMTSHTVVFATLAGAAAILMIPPTAIAIAEIFAGALSVLLQSYAAQQIDFAARDS